MCSIEAPGCSVEARSFSRWFAAGASTIWLDSRHFWFMTVVIVLTSRVAQEFWLWARVFSLGTLLDLFPPTTVKDTCITAVHLGPTRRIDTTGMYPILSYF